MRRFKLFLVSYLAVGLSGCVKYVYVPVSTCPVPPVISEPKIMTDTLTSRSSEDDILKYLLHDFLALRSSFDQCSIILNSYRK